MASSFLNVSQNVGGSLGIALLNNYVTNSVHLHAVRLGELLPPQSVEFVRFARETTQLTVRQAHGFLVTAHVKAGFAASQSIALRSEVLGFDNGFVFAGVVLFLAIPFCLLLKPAAHHLRGEEKGAEGLEAKVMAD